MQGQLGIFSSSASPWLQGFDRIIRVENDVPLIANREPGQLSRTGYFYIGLQLTSGIVVVARDQQLDVVTIVREFV